MKVIFFDVDGTLTAPKSGSTFKQSPTDIRVLEGVNKGILHFANRGYRAWGISNQGGCTAINKETGKPFKTEADTIEEMQNTLDILPQLSAIWFCPNFDGTKAIVVEKDKVSQCLISSQFPSYTDGIDGGYADISFRKPSPGMIFKIIEEYGLERSDDMWVIGDRAEDEGAATAAGINFMWADTWRSRFTPGMQQMEITPKQLEFLEGIKI